MNPTPSSPLAAEIHEGLDDVVVGVTRLCHIDGEAGQLVYRGLDAARLAESQPYEAVVHLLHEGRLPTAHELAAYRARMRDAGRLTPAEGDAVRRPAGGEPLAAIRTGLSAVAALRGLRPWLDRDPTEVRAEALSLGAAMPAVVTTVHAAAGMPPAGPGEDDSFAARYLSAMRGAPAPAALVRALDRYLVLTAHHGMNASTFVARAVASTGADVGSSLVAALGALSGPLHGGAPGPVLDMLDAIGEAGRARDWLARRVREGGRIMGFGHRVYRTDDPRAMSLRAAAIQAGYGRTELALAVEEAALEVLAEMKPGRSLRTNVEFWTAVTLEACGIPRALFTATFAVSRTAGWTAHVLEQVAHNRLMRPMVAYVGPTPQPPQPPRAPRAA